MNRRTNDALKNHQHINADSGSDEYYTPTNIVEAARRVMGTISLDPASSLAANKVVKAERIFTIIDDGLKQQWGGICLDESPVWKADKQALDFKAVQRIREWPSFRSDLHLLRINIRGMVQAAFGFSAVFPPQADELFSSRWNAQKWSNKRKCDYLFWK